MTTQRRNGILVLLAVVGGAGLLWLVLGVLARRRAAAAADPDAGSDGPRPLQDDSVILPTDTPTGLATATDILVPGTATGPVIGTVTGVPVVTGSETGTATATATLPTGFTPTEPGTPFTRNVVSVNTLSIPRSEHGRTRLIIPRVYAFNGAGAAVDFNIGINEFDTVTFGFTPAFTGKILID